MRIEEGKYYRTRDGRKVGPAKKLYGGRFEFDGAHSHCHASDGKYLGRDSSLDIVAEWTEGPVRTVQQIVPGTYDGVGVGSEVTGHPQREVMVRIATDHGPMVCMDADALDRAAAVLTALAGALRADG